MWRTRQSTEPSDSKCAPPHLSNPARLTLRTPEAQYSASAATERRASAVWEHRLEAMVLEYVSFSASDSQGLDKRQTEKQYLSIKLQIVDATHAKLDRRGRPKRVRLVLLTAAVLCCQLWWPSVFYRELPPPSIPLGFLADRRRGGDSSSGRSLHAACCSWCEDARRTSRTINIHTRHLQSRVSARQGNTRSTYMRRADAGARSGAMGWRPAS